MAHQVDDEVTDVQTAGLVIRLQLPRDELKCAVKTRLAGRILPSQKLIAVFAYDERKRGDSPL